MCSHSGCECRAFHSSFSCVCGAPWAEHRTTIETRAERSATSRPTHNLCGGGGVGEAACGGITRMSSLIPGVDRLESALPFTDAGFFAHRLPGGDAAPSREDVLRLLPDETIHLLASLLEGDEAPMEGDAASADPSGQSALPAPHSSVGPSQADRYDTRERMPSAGVEDGRTKQKSKRGTRSAAIASHDAALQREIDVLNAKAEDMSTSAATRSGLKKQIAIKKAALKRDAVPGLN